MSTGLCDAADMTTSHVSIFDDENDFRESCMSMESEHVCIIHDIIVGMEANANYRLVMQRTVFPAKSILSLTTSTGLSLGFGYDFSWCTYITSAIH